MADRTAFLESHQAKAEKNAAHFKQRLKLISWLRLILISLLLLLSYWAMQSDGNPSLLWAWAFGIPAFLIMVRLYEDLKEKMRFQEAKAKLCSEELSARKGELPRAAFERKSTANHNFARELDLFGAASLHHHINRAWTKAGAEALAQEMENPPYQDWQERQAFFKELEADPEWNLDYRAQGECGETKSGLIQIFKDWEQSQFKAFPIWYWPLMIAGILGVWATLYILIREPITAHFQWFMYALSFNLVLLGTRSKVLRAQQAQLSKVSEVLEAYAKLLDRLEKYSFQSVYGNSFKAGFKLDQGVGKKLKQLSALLNSLDQSANVVALFVLNGLFHYHLFRLRALQQWHQKYVSELEPWLNGLHQFEAYLSIANYHLNVEDFAWPKLTDECQFEASEMGHPLISAQQRVSNDLGLGEEQYIILTGSNMSGKSTFLRSIGVNMILAQMGAKVCAREMKLYPFQLLCSMNPQDDLRSETSYFQAEILRLSGLLKQLNPRRQSFFLLDEILRGTNSDDKQSGTRKFLQKIEGAPAWGIIATHDVDIAHMADENPNFRAAYFESRVKDDDLIFDYKLRAGICKTPNASLLMKRYGLI